MRRKGSSAGVWMYNRCRPGRRTEILAKELDMKRRMLVSILSTVVIVGAGVLVFLQGKATSVKAAPSVETVLVMCRFEGDPSVGIVVWTITKSSGAPATTATNCSQAVSDYLNQGYRVQSEELGSGSQFPVFHLAKL